MDGHSQQVFDQNIGFIGDSFREKHASDTRIEEARKELEPEMILGAYNFESFGNSNKQSIRSIQDLKKYDEYDPHGNEMRDFGKPKHSPNLQLSEVERGGEYYKKTYLPSQELMHTMATPCFQ